MVAGASCIAPFEAAVVTATLSSRPVQSASAQRFKKLALRLLVLYSKLRQLSVDCLQAQLLHVNYVRYYYSAPATQSDGGGSGTVPPIDSSSDDTATASDKDNAEVSEEPKDDPEAAQEYKDKLLRACLGTNRGFSCRREERSAISAIIKELEQLQRRVAAAVRLSATACCMLCCTACEHSGGLTVVFVSRVGTVSAYVLMLICNVLTLHCSRLNNTTPQWQQQLLNPNRSPNDGFDTGDSPLTGDWQLLFTDALDVLSLSLLPGISIGQISNIVELQPLLAPLLPSTLAQLTVKAKGSVSSSIRLDLTFEAAQFAPQTLFGRE
eukprot:8817-Heterococcus_DN1.PRE.1